MAFHSRTRRFLFPHSRLQTRSLTATAELVFVCTIPPWTPGPIAPFISFLAPPLWRAAYPLISVLEQTGEWRPPAKIQVSFFEARPATFSVALCLSFALMSYFDFQLPLSRMPFCFFSSLSGTKFLNGLALSFFRKTVVS